jgi:hypothetical protein
LVTNGTCSSGAPATFSIPALGVGDHAAGLHAVTYFELKAGTYCSLELPLVVADAASVPATAPASLIGNSLLIEGTLQDGTPFSILSRTTPTLRLVSDAAAGFAIDADAPAVLITFDVASWLTGLDFASATRNSGAIVISSSENSALLSAFEAKIASGVALYRDTDGDGRLDENPTRLAHAE